MVPIPQAFLVKSQDPVAAGSWLNFPLYFPHYCLVPALCVKHDSVHGSIRSNPQARFKSLEKFCHRAQEGNTEKSI